MLIQVLIICAWLVYLLGFLLLLAVLERFRSRRTLLRLLLCTASLITSALMLWAATSVDVPDSYADTSLTRILGTAAGWLHNVLVVTGVAVFVVAAVRGLPNFRTR